MSQRSTSRTSKQPSRDGDLSSQFFSLAGRIQAWMQAPRVLHSSVASINIDDREIHDEGSESKSLGGQFVDQFGGDVRDLQTRSTVSANAAIPLTLKQQYAAAVEFLRGVGTDHYLEWLSDDERIRVESMHLDDLTDLPRVSGEDACNPLIELIDWLKDIGEELGRLNSSDLVNVNELAEFAGLSPKVIKNALKPHVPLKEGKRGNPKTFCYQVILPTLRTTEKHPSVSNVSWPNSRTELNSRKIPAKT